MPPSLCTRGTIYALSPCPRPIFVLLPSTGIGGGEGGEEEGKRCRDLSALDPVPCPPCRARKQLMMGRSSGLSTSSQCAPQSTCWQSHTPPRGSTKPLTPPSTRSLIRKSRKRSQPSHREVLPMAQCQLPCWLYQRLQRTERCSPPSKLPSFSGTL